MIPTTTRLREEFAKVERILVQTPVIDKFRHIPAGEYAARRARVLSALESAGIDIGFAFSNEHYAGDVPYLGGNTNIQIEQVAAAIGKAGFRVISGLEGGYLAEQLSRRADAPVARIEMLKLAGEDYTLAGGTLEEVLEQVSGTKARTVGLLSPREVIPAAFVRCLEENFGPENVIDCQALYGKIKYEKSDNELALIRDASLIADSMMRAMLAVLKPGMLETQVAAWGYFVGRELGAEEMGWDIMVGANSANRTLIGKALNRKIEEGDFVHLGVAPKRDGLNTCLRRSCVAVERPEQVAGEQRYWLNFVEEAYGVGLSALQQAAANNSPAGIIEETLQQFYRERSASASQKVGKKIELDVLKPYSSIHNAGYTECQEFYGAVTVNSHEPLGKQIVLMLDVALRGIHEGWSDVIIPGLDFVVVENTLGKFGPRVEEFTCLPRNVQHLVAADERELN